VNRHRLLALVAALGLALGVAVPASAAPAPCYGTVVIQSVVNYEVRTADGTTFTSFDFTGTHELCLSDGTLVEGTIAGHLDQALTSGGVLTLHFAETLTYGSGTLDFVGDAIANGDVWRGSVRSVGAGTGDLAGISGQGRFWPTSATSFGDVINYVYPRS
jgi:hypothetical protein